jgi:hypothetical protein
MLHEDGDRRSAEVLIVEVDDVTDLFWADVLGRERYQFRHWTLTIKAAPNFQYAPIRVKRVAPVK